MKVLLLTIGSRGDVEPFIEVGYLLEKYGHEVAYALPEQYLNLFSGSVNIYSLGPEFMNLINSSLGKNVMGRYGNPLEMIKWKYKLYKEGFKMSDLMTLRQKQLLEEIQPDLVIFHPKCLYPFLKQPAPFKKLVLSPVPYVIHAAQEQPHLGFKRTNIAWWNKFSYTLANKGLMVFLKRAAKKTGNPKPTSKNLDAILKNTKCVFSVSPSLIPQSTDWPEHVKVLGFRDQKNSAVNNVDTATIDFFKRHQKVLVVSFGSMTNSNPEKTTEIIIEVLKAKSIPAIINIAGGGLTVLPAYKYDHSILFTKQLNYSWVFDKAYAVIHHGGSGTTHNSLKYGCATLILPHIVDQFMWNEINFTQGTGPKGVAINKINKENLNKLITDLWQNESYKINAERLGKIMKNENLDEQLIAFINN